MCLLPLRRTAVLNLYRRSAVYLTISSARAVDRARARIHSNGSLSACKQSLLLSRGLLRLHCVPHCGYLSHRCCANVRRVGIDPFTARLCAAVCQSTVCVDGHSSLQRSSKLSDYRKRSGCMLPVVVEILTGPAEAERRYQPQMPAALIVSITDESGFGSMSMAVPNTVDKRFHTNSCVQYVPTSACECVHCVALRATDRSLRGLPPLLLTAATNKWPTDLRNSFKATVKPLCSHSTWHDYWKRRVAIDRTFAGESRSLASTRIGPSFTGNPSPCRNHQLGTTRSLPPFARCRAADVHITTVIMTKPTPTRPRSAMGWSAHPLDAVGCRKAYTYVAVHTITV